MSTRQEPITVAYKHIGSDRSNPVLFDLYLPPADPNSASSQGSTPTVVYFHGGGMAVGNKDWFPSWLYDRLQALGYAFISANYQLLPQSSGHEILKDLQDLFAYLAENEIKGSGRTYKVDVNKIAVAGSSAGGQCAYLAAMHCSPKPKVLLGIYPPGGKVLSSHYLHEKKKSFFMGRDLLDASEFQRYIYPFKGETQGPFSDAPVSFDPHTGLPDNPRVFIPPLYLQLGTFVDYYTGQHEPSLSATLRSVLDKNPNASLEDFRSVIPENQQYLFLELIVDRSWPPTVLLHGTADTAVLTEESHHLQQLLKDAGVPVTLLLAPGKEHLFDMYPNAENEHGEQFNKVKDFLVKYLGPA